MLNKILSNFSAQILSIISNFFLSIFTNRILNPDGRGQIAALISWNILFFTFGYLSVHIGIINVYPTLKNKINKIITGSIVLGILLGIMTVIFGIILFYKFPFLFYQLHFSLFILMISVVPLMIIQNYFQTILQISGFLKEYNLIILFNLLLNFILIILFIVLEKYNLINGIYIIFINYLFSFFITTYFLFSRTNYYFNFDYFTTIRILKIGVVAHFATIATFLSSKIDVIIVNGFLGNEEAGIYFLASTIVGIMNIIPMSIQCVLYHKISNDNINNFKETVLKISKITFLFMVIVGLLLLLFSSFIVLMLGGNKFFNAVYLIRILIPGIVFLSLPVILSSMWNIIGIFKYLNYLSVISIISLISLNFIFIPILGSKGAALSNSLNYFICFLIHLYFIKKFLKIDNIFKIFLINKEDVLFLKSLFR